MRKVLMLLALGAIGAGVAAWAAPMPSKAAEAARNAEPSREGAR